MKKSVLLLFLFLCTGLQSFAQLTKPVIWNLNQRSLSNKGEIELSITAKIQSGWHIYSTKLPDGGPVKTSFTFTPDSSCFRLIGETTPLSAPTKEFDKIFNMDLEFFSKEVVFVQKIRLLTPKSFEIKGSVEYQSCNDETCTLDEHDFSMKIQGNEDSLVTTPVTKDSQENTGHGLWWFLIFSFIAGLAAILTPCVFPMIPMTVSFFMNSSKSKAQARMQAFIYGGSIILIYTLIGTLVALTLGADFANWISTHWIPNVLFLSFLSCSPSHFSELLKSFSPEAGVTKQTDLLIKEG